MPIASGPITQVAWVTGDLDATERLLTELIQPVSGPTIHAAVKAHAQEGTS